MWGREQALRGLDKSLGPKHEQPVTAGLEGLGAETQQHDRHVGQSAQSCVQKVEAPTKEQPVFDPALLRAQQMAADAAADCLSKDLVRRLKGKDTDEGAEQE